MIPTVQSLGDGICYVSGRAEIAGLTLLVTAYGRGADGWELEARNRSPYTTIERYESALGSTTYRRNHAGYAELRLLQHKKVMAVVRELTQ